MPSIRFPSRTLGSFSRPRASQRSSISNSPSLRQSHHPAKPSRATYVSALLHPRFQPCLSVRRSSSSLRYYSSPATPVVENNGNSEAELTERPEPPDYLNEKERSIFERLNEAFEPVALQVEDISGGCGSMYAVAITAEKFRGLPVIRQHRLVNEVLGEDIKSWHGIQLRTKAP